MGTLGLRDRDPWRIIGDRWAIWEEVDAILRAYMEGAARVRDGEGEDLVSLQFSAQLLMAMGDFIDSIDPESEYSISHQLTLRTLAWRRRREELLAKSQPKARGPGKAGGTDGRASLGPPPRL